MFTGLRPCAEQCGYAVALIFAQRRCGCNDGLDRHVNRIGCLVQILQVGQRDSSISADFEAGYGACAAMFFDGIRIETDEFGESGHTKAS